MGARIVPHPPTVLFSYKFEAFVPLPITIPGSKLTTRLRQLNRAEGVKIMPSVYAPWVGQTVVLQVATGDLRVPLHGIIVGESEDAVRFRIGEGWDIDIYKLMILAVEQDRWATVIS
jgi:hypothetical protein